MREARCLVIYYEIKNFILKISESYYVIKELIYKSDLCEVELSIFLYKIKSKMFN